MLKSKKNDKDPMNVIISGIVEWTLKMIEYLFKYIYLFKILTNFGGVHRMSFPWIFFPCQ